MDPVSSAKLGAFDPELPLEKARTIPSFWYTDPEIFAAESQKVFGLSWLAVGRVDQVAEPGHFFTTSVAGEPIVVVRDSTGELRAFYNVCRHRAARVAIDPAGKTSRFRCRYHGWTYDLTGRLRGTPEFEGVQDFCKEDQGLKPLAVAVWGPLVWIHMGPDPEPLTGFLAPLPQRMAEIPLERLRFVERREYKLACNWKVFVDNYLDGGYHINTIHPGLAGVIDYSQYRNEIAGNTCLQTGPIHPGEKTEGINRVRQGTAYYWWIYPNLMLNIYDEVMDTNLVLPTGIDSCTVVFDFYFARTEGEETRRWIADSIAVSDQIQKEDMEICEDVQLGLRSRAFRTGRFCVRREGPGYHFHRLLYRSLTAESVDLSLIP